jgi:hypothetical protein
MIGLMLEDFETHNFTKYNWDTLASNSWTITNTGAYEGNYCTKSATIGNMQSSILSIALTVLGNDSISFYSKVSSEQDWDFLNFKIDGNIAGSWSGSTAWEKQSYAVTPGNHIFSWVYEKDINTASGNDCAWVDFISLPAVYSTIGVGINDLSAENSAQLMVYPNPATSDFKIVYTLLEKSDVNIRMYDAKGQLIFNRVEEKQAAANHIINFNASDLRNGVYVLSLQTDKQMITRKIILTR